MANLEVVGGRGADTVAAGGGAPPAGPPRRPSAPALVRGEVRDRAGVLESADALDALLAAHARLLHAAEGGAEVQPCGAVVVDPDVAALQLPTESVGRLGVRGPDGAAQPAPAVVRQPHGL